MATPLEAALEYANRGWPVIPLHYPISKGKCSCGKPDCDSPAKHPMTPHGLKDATKDSSQIKSWWNKSPKANVGIVTGSDSGLVVLDVDPRNGGSDSLKSISKLGNFPITPEVFTGGGGEHLFMSHPGNGTKIKSAHSLGGYPGIDLKGDGGYVVAPPSIHISGGRYTWKRHHLKNRVAPMPRWFVENLVDARQSAPPGARLHNNNIIISSRADSVTDGSSIYPPLFCDAEGILSLPTGVRDDTLFEIAAALKRGGMPRGKIEQVVATLGERACQESFGVNQSLKKVESAFANERNYSAEIKSYIASQNRYLDVTYLDKEFQYDTQRHKASRRMVIHRLVEAKILEPGPRVGVFRILNNTRDWMNLVEDDEASFLPLKWPLGLESFVDIPPKGIIVCAGSKDSGKTVFALNTIAQNMNSIPTYYFSSEMGEFALKKRLKNFDWPLSTWNFKAKEVSTDFHDEIIPDAFNIVDYLEITDKFWLVAEEIRQIFDKLTTGAALICLQKAEGAKLARGQDFSVEKAHLYLTLDRGDKERHNCLTIVSGKFWHQEDLNPRGITIKYNIWKGYKLIEK